MKFLQNILKSPIRNTVIFFSVSFITYLFFALASLYLTRIMCAASFDTTSSCSGTNLQMFISTILNDFEFIFRTATELSVVVLISQGIYRLVRRRSK